MTAQEIKMIVQENTALHTEVSALKEELSYVQQQLDWLKKQVFGRKSEQTSVVLDNAQLSLFDDETKVVEKTETITVPEHKRRKKRTHDDWMSALPVEEKIYKEEHPICEKCGAEMKDMGNEKTYDELVYSPAKFYIRRHIIKKYKCTRCGQDPKRDSNYPDDIERCNIKRTKAPKQMIPGSYCSSELLAHVIYEKYGKAVPLHRQANDFASKGVPLLKATMVNWIAVAVEKWCLPIIQKMKELLFAENVIHADETTVRVLHEEGRKSTSVFRMWVYCNGKENEHHINIFDYQPTRKGTHAAEFLGGFGGYPVCDGYDAYNAVTGAKRCGCWTHTGRHFVDALPKDKLAYVTSVAAKAVDLINEIYHEEGKLSELPEKERHTYRLAKIRPLLDDFFAWLESLPIGGKNNLVKAIRYALNEKKYLYTFLQNGNVPLDNNRAENAIRPFAIGRKNRLFSNTANGAKCSAVLYSLISTAQANKLDAEDYLTELFKRPAGTILLPWRSQNE